MKLQEEQGERAIFCSCGHNITFHAIYFINSFTIKLGACRIKDCNCCAAMLDDLSCKQVHVS